MKGIILAGGLGTRLYPLSEYTSKQLLHIYNKPMIYYPLSIMMLSGIREILIISTPKYTPILKELLGSGNELGCSFQFIEQTQPDGIGSAFILGEKFIGNDDVMLLLGDNIFHGTNFIKILRDTLRDFKSGATIFGYYVKDPSQYGVIEFKNGKPFTLIEKPTENISNYAVPGIYIYDKSVISISKKIGFSQRGEREITSINNFYLDNEQLEVKLLSRGIAWLDTGTFKDLLAASNFIMTLEERQGLIIGAVEEVAYRMGYINKPEYKSLLNGMPNTKYKEILLKTMES